MRSYSVSACSATRWPCWRASPRVSERCSTSRTRELFSDLKSLFLALESALRTSSDTLSVCWPSSLPVAPPPQRLSFITVRVRRSRGEMYIGHGRLCVCVCVCVCLSVPHYCTDPDVTWGNGRECPLVVHNWVDLQSIHGFCCYDNIRVCKLIAL